jgi:hypothetical protein
MEEASGSWAHLAPGGPGRAGVGPPLGPLRPGGFLILLDAPFLGAKPR